MRSYHLSNFLFSGIVFFAIISVKLTSTGLLGNVIYVTNTFDSGAGSLRHGIFVSAPGDTVMFSPLVHGDTIEVVSTWLTIDKSLTLIGPVLPRVTLSGRNSNGIAYIPNAWDAVKFENIDFYGGKASNSPSIHGAAIYSLGALTTISCKFKENICDYDGGAICSFGKLFIRKCRFDNNQQMQNQGNGGAILVYDSTWIVNSTFSNNVAHGNGGAIYVMPNSPYLYLDSCKLNCNTCYETGGALFSNCRLFISKCTFHCNLALSGGGGGIRLTYGSQSKISYSTLSANGGGGLLVSDNVSLEIINSTISYNAAYESGGIHIDSSQFPIDSIFIENCTIASNECQNSACGILSERPNIAKLKNTIVAQNGLYDVSGIIESLGHNLIGVNPPLGQPGFQGIGSDLIGNSTNPIDPMLLYLQHNGGLTETRELMECSPAVDAGNAGIYTTDQRGEPRNYNGFDDIGAFELQAPGCVLSEEQIMLSAQREGRTARLFFQLTGPQVQYYLIEKSPHSDLAGSEIIVINQTQRNLEYLDASPYFPNTYYRIFGLDVNGNNKAFSNISQVNFGLQNDPVLFIEPDQRLLSVILPARDNQECFMELLNIAGVVTTRLSGRIENKKCTWDISQIPDGVYSANVRLAESDEVYFFRFVKSP